MRDRTDFDTIKGIKCDLGGLLTMEKRKMDKLGIAPSLLGFGCMRFPTLENGKIDEVTAEKMLDEAMAQGVTYYDTAFPYHGGDSEPFVGRVLNKYDRSSYFLATKLPIWLVETREAAEKMFEDQLKRLDKEYVDFYPFMQWIKNVFRR